MKLIFKLNTIKKLAIAIIMLISVLACKKNDDSIESGDYFLNLTGLWHIQDQSSESLFDAVYFSKDSIVYIIDIHPSGMTRIHSGPLLSKYSYENNKVSNNFFGSEGFQYKGEEILDVSFGPLGGEPKRLVKDPNIKKLNEVIFTIDIENDTFKYIDISNIINVDANGTMNIDSDDEYIYIPDTENQRYIRVDQKTFTVKDVAYGIGDATSLAIVDLNGPNNLISALDSSTDTYTIYNNANPATSVSPDFSVSSNVTCHANIINSYDMVTYNKDTGSLKYHDIDLFFNRDINLIEKLDPAIGITGLDYLLTRNLLFIADPANIHIFTAKQNDQKTNIVQFSHDASYSLATNYLNNETSNIPFHGYVRGIDFNAQTATLYLILGDSITNKIGLYAIDLN